MQAPPLKYVLDALQTDVLPAAGGAAFVLCLFLFLGRWAAALGSAAAIVVAFLWANFTLGNLKLDDKPTWENIARLIPFKPGEDPPGWHWLPRAALVLVVVGLLSRWLGLLATRLLPERLWWGSNLLVWAPRLAGVVLVSGWLSSGKAAAAPEWEWLRLQLILSMLFIWIALDGIARADAGAEVAAYQAAIFLVGGTILLYTHNALLMELAVILGCGMFAIAVVAGLGQCDTSGAVPAGVAFLPGLIFATRPSLEPHNVPPICLWCGTLPRWPCHACFPRWPEEAGAFAWSAGAHPHAARSAIYLARRVGSCCGGVHSPGPYHLVVCFSAIVTPGTWQLCVRDRGRAGSRRRE